MKMNSTRCSRGIAAVLGIVCLLAIAGPVSAFTVSADGVPGETAVGDEISVTYTIDDPFTDAPDEWTLAGETGLQNVSWTVTVLRAGNPVEDGETTAGGQNFTRDLAIDNNGDQVRVELVGTVPEVGNYTYQPEEQFLVASLSRTTGDNTQEFQNDTAHHYTEDSRAAREAIASAQQAVENAPGDNSDARADIDRAISAYEGENFENAISLAEEAQSQAQQAQQSQQTTQTLLLVGGAVVVLLLLGGGVYWWSQQGDDYSKL